MRVDFVNSKESFYSYTTVLNPYDGVYPEEGLSATDILTKIFDYENKGGTFVNVADVPRFWA